MGLVNFRSIATMPTPIQEPLPSAGAALAGFPWPTPPGASAAPVWRDGRFLLDGQPQRVLSYDAADSHWSAELTELHEAEAGSDHPIDKLSRHAAVRSLTRSLPPGGHPIVLDVGCSSGFVIGEIHAALPRVAVVGSDYLLSPLEGLAARLPGVPLLQFDLRRCPLPDACVDAVTALNVLEHIDDDTQALREIARVLRPGGVAHIEVPAGPGCYDFYDEVLMHHRRYTSRELLAKARTAGFVVERATHLGCLIYPAFWFVKKRHQRLAHLSTDEKRRLVADSIRTTVSSTPLALVLGLEGKLGQFVNFPFGIRCVAVLRKPAA
jgi:SAM-dependent methyltransferase